MANGFNFEANLINFAVILRAIRDKKNERPFSINDVNHGDAEARS